MDRDREANTRCTWFTQIGYVHGVEEFSLIVKGLHKYIGSSYLLVRTNVASSLEVRFLHPGVVSLTGEDAQVDVSARVLLCLSPHASLYPSHLPYLFLKQMWYLLWKHKMLKMSTREQCQVSNQARGSRQSVSDWKLDSKC
ncbi:hypothetical protein ACFX19_007100 [Malus domestica]